ncbi:hypothetical protein J6590_093913 [Homalodisca vitripennis]|nr:hypothetical protein J6590_093913 [Homalodisca vitripennis]
MYRSTDNAVRVLHCSALNYSVYGVCGRVASVRRTTATNKVVRDKCYKLPSPVRSQAELSAKRLPGQVHINIPKWEGDTRYVSPILVATYLAKLYFDRGLIYSAQSSCRRKSLSPFSAQPISGSFLHVAF